jgi:hypothetical protein
LYSEIIGSLKARIISVSKPTLIKGGIEEDEVEQEETGNRCSQTLKAFEPLDSCAARLAAIQ